MNYTPFKSASPPTCPQCGSLTERLGKLPQIGFHRILYVYRCAPCIEIITITPAERSEPLLQVRAGHEADYPGRSIDVR